MSEYPKVEPFRKNDGIRVTFANGEGIWLRNTNIRALHAVLTEKIAELEAEWKKRKGFA